MPKVRQLFNAVTVQEAKAKRICHHNRKKHGIQKGDLCLVIKGADGGSKNYCLGCATEILDQAELDLQQLRDDLV
jgi:hypothetical protein